MSWFIPTKHEFEAFLLGAAIGSIVTWWNTTRERRLVSNVRKEIRDLSFSYLATKQLTPKQSHKLTYEHSALASYEEILKIHALCKAICNSRKRTARIRVFSSWAYAPALVHMTSDLIICTRVLGLTDNEFVPIFEDAIEKNMTAKEGVALMIARMKSNAALRRRPANDQQTPSRRDLAPSQLGTYPGVQLPPRMSPDAAATPWGGRMYRHLCYLAIAMLLLGGSDSADGLYDQKTSISAASV
jgi:hypothetical protein